MGAGVGRARGGDLGRCALAAALGFGTYFVLLHEASAADQYWATAVARISGGAGALILAVGLRRRGGASSPAGIRWPGLALAAPVFAFDAVGDAAFAVGAAAGSLGLAAIVASMYPAVTVLLNRSLRRERMHKVHLYGVLATLFAVACLAW